MQDGYAPLNAHSRTLIDYTTLVNVYQGCASLAPANLTAPLNLAGSAGRCTSLKAKGLLTATTTTDQAIEAQQIINNYGILTEQNPVQPGYWFANVPQSISVTYANTYGRFSVADNLCDFSFGVGAAAEFRRWRPRPRRRSSAPATAFRRRPGCHSSTMRLPAARRRIAPRRPTRIWTVRCACARWRPVNAIAMATATVSGNDDAKRVEKGVRDILADGKLGGVPAIFVTGRNDAILPPNHTSRAYYGLNQIEEGRKSKLRYYEVTNAQHLDSFNQFPGYNAAYIPLHRYYIQAMDLMYAHLRTARALPPSQVVHTIPRGPGAPPITAANVPPISNAPAGANLITMSGGRLKIPN